MTRSLLRAVVVTVLTGCGAPPAAPAPNPAPTTVTVMPAQAQAPSGVEQRRAEDYIGGVTSLVEDASAPRADGAAPAVAITDPARAKALEQYGAQLARFLRQRWQIPTSVPVAEAARLCVTFQANVSRSLVIWHVRAEPTKASGNALFDDSARAMLEKLLQDRTPLPEPPPEVADLFRGRTLVLVLPGNPKADGASCK